MIVVLVLLHDGDSQGLYLIPSLAWHERGSRLMDRDYEGRAGAQERGVSLSGKSMELASGFAFERGMQNLECPEALDGVEKPW